MKKLLSLVAILSMVVVPAWGWSYTEGTKVVCTPKKELCITVPEMAPDFLLFPNARIVAQQTFANGNMIAMISTENECGNTSTHVLLVRIDGIVHVVAMAAFYEDTGKKGMYEDIAYVTTGKPSGVLAETNAPNGSDAFIK